jgi:hypothetical protein
MLTWTFFFCGMWNSCPEIAATFSYTLYITYELYPGSRDSVVGTATDYELEDRGVGF